MYTVKQIRDAVEADFDDNWGEFLSLIDDENGAELPSLGAFAKQEDEGGESRPWVVFSVGEQFFEKNGTHDSWEGTEWDGGFQEVFPFKETITVFRSK